MGRGLYSPSRRHIGALGKYLRVTRSCLWRFGVKLRHSIRAVSGTLLSRSKLEEALWKYPECINEWIIIFLLVMKIKFKYKLWINRWRCIISSINNQKFLVRMPTWNLSTCLLYFWARIDSTYSRYNAQANANRILKYGMLVYFKHIIKYANYLFDFIWRKLFDGLLNNRRQPCAVFFYFWAFCTIHLRQWNLRTKQLNHFCHRWVKISNCWLSCGPPKFFFRNVTIFLGGGERVFINYSPIEELGLL